LRDIAEAQCTHLQIDWLGRRVWVNVDGGCVLRIKDAGVLEVDDDRDGEQVRHVVSAYSKYRKEMANLHGDDLDEIAARAVLFERLDGLFKNPRFT
jgi:hypothetical protein